MARVRLYHAEAALTRAMSEDQWIQEGEVKRLQANVDLAQAAMEWIDAHEKDDRAKLVRFCGMLGSANECERAQAAAAADKMVRRRGLNWGDVIALEG